MPVVTRHLRARAGQVVVLPNAIDLVAASAFAGPADGTLLRRRHGIGLGETVFLSVGRLEWSKGFDVLAEALGYAARAGRSLGATGWRWVLVGSGPFRHEIEQRVNAAGIAPHVIFTGRATDRDLHAWYEAASIFVHPTRYEGSSLVTLEAMSHRRPVVATRAGGLPDKVRPDENGWLVEPGDVEGLARAIEEAASHTPRLAVLGARSREIVEREFAWPVIAERHEALYRQLVAATKTMTRP
jgi:glycosyltransferase involved in cell wall biosynthesis